MAIKFLNSESISTRRHIRKIVLNESHESVAFPECHALGLIPFCLENSRLRLQRRLNLWRNVLPHSHEILSGQMVAEAEERQALHDDGWDDYMLPGCIVPAFGLWIREVLALPAAGMPTNSFSLVFEGYPNPDQSIEVFEIVLRDIAWHSAVQRYCHEKSLTLAPSYLRSRRLFEFSSFPQAIKDIVENQSCISCDFPIGYSWDSDKIYLENKDLTEILDWSDRHDELEPEFLGTEPPLPSWINLRMEELISKAAYQAELAGQRCLQVLDYF